MNMVIETTIVQITNINNTCMEILFQTIKKQKRLPERKDVVEHLQLKA